MCVYSYGDSNGSYGDFTSPTADNTLNLDDPSLYHQHDRHVESGIGELTQDLNNSVLDEQGIYIYIYILTC